jgi:LysM repeat protein
MLAPEVVQPVSNQAINVTMDGDVSGQVAVGNHIIQIGHVSGGLVYLAQPGEQPTPQARPTPVLLRPRPMRGLLDRQVEKREITQAITAVSPAELHGQPGIGKSALLRHLAHQLPLNAFPDGLIHLSAQGLTREDLAQNLFDAFYESPIPVKPTEAALRHALQNKRALILLDDVDLPADDLEALMDIAPGCLFLWTGGERRLWLDGESHELGGLPPADGLALFERALGRSLTAAERATAVTLCATLEGHPGQIIQAAALLREERETLPALLARLHGRNPADLLTISLYDPLPKEEKRLLASLAALGDGELSDKQAARLADLSRPHQTISALARRGLVQAEGRTVRLAAGVGPALAPQINLTLLRLQAINYFTDRVGQSALTLTETAVLRPLLTWAVDHGYWPEAIRLARLLDGPLAAGRLWGSWQAALRACRQAAQASGDLAAEAWAWHQLGTRALCLGEKQAARHALLKALRLRQQLGDGPGTTVTRHNLNLLLGPPDRDRDHGNEKGRLQRYWPDGVTKLFTLGLVAGLLLVAALLLYNSLDAAPIPPITETAVEMVPSHPTETKSPTATATGTATATATPTATPTATTQPPTPLPQCVVRPPANWTPYLVQRGDTLFSLARQTSTTVGRIKQVNCLNSDTIFYGTNLYLPARPTATPTTTATTTPTVSVVTTEPIGVTETPTPTITLTPTPTITLTPTPCPPLAVEVLTATSDGKSNFVEWLLTGGCPRYVGVLTAQFVEESAYAEYSVEGEYGIQSDAPPARCGYHTVVYELQMYDRNRQVATAEYWLQMYWVCEEKGDSGRE